MGYDRNTRAYYRSGVRISKPMFYSAFLLVLLSLVISPVSGLETISHSVCQTGEDGVKCTLFNSSLVDPQFTQARVWGSKFPQIGFICSRKTVRTRTACDPTDHSETIKQKTVYENMPFSLCLQAITSGYCDGLKLTTQNEKISTHKPIQLIFNEDCSKRKTKVSNCEVREIALFHPDPTQFLKQNQEVSSPATESRPSAETEVNNPARVVTSKAISGCAYGIKSPFILSLSEKAYLVRQGVTSVIYRRRDLSICAFQLRRRRPSCNSRVVSAAVAVCQTQQNMG